MRDVSKKHMQWIPDSQFSLLGMYKSLLLFLLLFICFCCCFWGFFNYFFWDFFFQEHYRLRYCMPFKNFHQDLSLKVSYLFVFVSDGQLIIATANPNGLLDERSELTPYSCKLRFFDTYVTFNMHAHTFI